MFSFSRTKTDRKMKIVARCCVMEHERMTRGQYVYGRKLAEFDVNRNEP